MGPNSKDKSKNPAKVSIKPSSRTPRYSNEDKNLISEQPGRFVLFSGVLLAVILGLMSED